jgi:hypothetical protein
MPKWAAAGLLVKMRKSRAAPELVKIVLSMFVIGASGVIW